MDKIVLKFPESFLWGAATAAHQVEGGNHNDWSIWEEKNANWLARTALNRLKVQTKYTGVLPDWDKIKSQSADPQNYISGVACDHYHLYEKDFDLAQRLNHNAYRFSVEWSRIEPREGVWVNSEIEYYHRMIENLRRRQIEPIVSLWHFTLPIWVANHGGWRSLRTIDLFVRFVEEVVHAFKGKVKFWVVLNEPMIYTGAAYFEGAIPPQEKSITSCFRVISNLIKAYRKAYQTIKSIDPLALVSIAKNNVFFEASPPHLFNSILKKLADHWWNFYFLDQIQNDLDFIGLNYYFHNRINGWFNRNENNKISDLGWELYPEGIYHVLKDLSKYQKPIYITENGLADAADQERSWFIKETLRNVHRAILEGVEVRGYLYWSLLDNFEWEKGFWPRFGLIEVDHRTQARRIRESAWEYAKIIRNNAVQSD